MGDLLESNRETAVLAGLNADSLPDIENSNEASLDELEALLETAGGQCVAKVLQNKDAPDPRTFIGAGKAEEIRDLVNDLEADMVVFDNELNASQIRALEEVTGVTVLDRSTLILDIFAQRAKTREGRLQVELAQYKYLLPRLSGMGKSMSRLGGGIGTRGPGETKLETDRRHIRSRISKLESELADVRKVRGVQRESRIKNEVPTVALVGYTNSGKSTILNLFTDAQIPANDRLFDTLDTTSRKFTVSDTFKVILSDTVGFIDKLPHHLVEAFKATLEELQYADLLLHIVDISNPDWEKHMEVVQRLISELAREGTPVIEVFNKIDLVEKSALPGGAGRVYLSAKTGEGSESLRQLIISELGAGQKCVNLLLPYDRSDLLDMLYRQAKVEQADYTDEGISVRLICNMKQYGLLREYILECGQ